jgi:hypothetical protein
MTVEIVKKHDVVMHFLARTTVVSSLCPMEYDMVQGGFYQASYF